MARRNRTDRAQVEAHRDDLLKAYRSIGHSRPWLRVLLGHGPGIILPIGKVDESELETFRVEAAKFEVVGKLPEAEYTDEMKPFLSDEQLEALRRCRPVIFTQVVERQLAPATPRTDTSFVSRWRDAREFGMAQSLFYMGLLTRTSRTGGRISERGAVEAAAAKLSSEWWPAGGRLRQADRYTTLLEMHKAGNKSYRRAEFMDPSGAAEQVRAYVRAAQGDEAKRRAELSFWYTIAVSILRTTDHDREQASALNTISRGLRELIKYGRTEWLTYLGERRRAVTPDELVSLAYFGLPDLERLFPVHARFAAHFRLSALLGELSRGRIARIDGSDHVLLTEIMQTGEQSSQSQDAAPSLMTSNKFLQHAVHRVADNQWWLRVILAPVDYRVAVHAEKGEDLGFHPNQVEFRPGWRRLAGAVYRNDMERKFAVNGAQKALVSLLASYSFKFDIAPLHGHNLWAPKVADGEQYAFLDAANHRRFGLSQGSRLMESLLQLVAACMRSEFGFEDAQVEDYLKPGYWREHARIAVAVLTVVGDADPGLSERLRSDLRYYAPNLTDREYDVCVATGELTGNRIKSHLEEAGINQDFPFGMT